MFNVVRIVPFCIFRICLRRFNGLIRPYIKETGRIMENGFVTYPEVFFDDAFVDSAVNLE